MRRVVAALGIAAVIAAGTAAAAGALAAYRTDRELSAATVRLWSEPAREGALDLYVPLVDWGARFPVVDLPARLRVDVRAVRREQVARLATDRRGVARLRREAEDAIESYIRNAVLFATLVALLGGALVAAAVRGGAGPRLRWSLAAAALTAVGCGAAVALLLPPRGALGEPEYYAHGPEIPQALAALDTVTRSISTLGDELDAQLIGLTRLVTAPAGRDPAALDRITVASDLHNNLLALPALERAAEGTPLFFAGDLTDRGSPLEAQLVDRLAQAGSRFVFVSGNHDSDLLERALARRGAVVLSERGRLRADGSYGPIVVTVGGVRVAGYRDPFQRRSGERFRDRFAPLTDAQRERFAAWLRPLVGRVDVVMVHSPELAADALTELRARGGPAPVFVVGHTHAQAIDTTGGVVALNGGTAGAGGPTNLAEQQDVGLARLVYRRRPAFAAIAAELIEIDPASGSATARHERLDR